MKIYQLDGSGKVEGLRIGERSIPKPRRGQVLARMRAASLNYRDVIVLENRYSVPVPLGLIPLSDGAGEIVELGEDVTRVRLGERVAGTFFPKWIAGPLPDDGRSEMPGANKDGMLAEYVVFDENALVRIPDHLSFEDASTLPCAALTAWALFTAPRPVLPGEIVLTQGTGGVSIFVLQLAKLAGARVITTTSDDAKAERLRALGADDIINYRTDPDWAKTARELTDDRGVDHIIEIGGAGTLEKSITASAIGAQINMVGVLEHVKHVDATLFMRGIANIRRITVESRAAFEAMNRAIAFHRLKPVIDRVFPFDEAQAAYKHLIGRHHLGKVVISIG